MRFPPFVALLYLFVLTFAWPRLAIAQTGTGELTGEVRDPSGATMAGARVALTETSTNETFESLTGSGGVYAFSSQKPGVYNLAVEANGFKRFTQEGITVTTGERVRADISLSVGSLTDNITVSADARLLRTDSATLGQVVDVRTISTLPLNGRTFINLVGLAPGIALPPSSALPRLSGSRPRTNEYLYDGIPVAVTQSTNFNSFAGFGTQRPNCVGDTSLPESKKSTAQFINVAGFEIAPQFTLGTCSRNPVRGPDTRTRI